jgi:hypothetical protein
VAIDPALPEGFEPLLTGHPLPDLDVVALIIPNTLLDNIGIEALEKDSLYQALLDLLD